MTTPVLADNPYAEAARVRKAAALETVLRAAGADTPAVILALDPTTQRLAERTAHVRPSSDRTWRLVAVLSAARDRGMAAGSR